MNEHHPESVELVPVERTLFQTNDPVEVLDHARRVADALKTALDQSGMVQKIGSNEHVRIDGWQTLGSMLGVSAQTVWSRPIWGGSSDGWEARAEARTLNGQLVGTAEAMCTRSERNWKTREDFQLRSMAQTRAMSKALRGPLGFIITLAGKNATPAEELDDTSEYGPAAGKAHVNDALRAAEVLTGSQDTATTLMLHLEKDAGGYLPRIVARAVQLVAAHRPDRTEVPNAENATETAGTATPGTKKDTPPPDEPE